MGDVSSGVMSIWVEATPAGKTMRGETATYSRPLSASPAKSRSSPVRWSMLCATKYDEVSYLEVMTKDLKVMDATAIAFCRDNDIPIVVFDMSNPGSLRSIVQGGSEGTLVHVG